MKKFIHLRGSMATGKTSTARAVLARGNYEVRFIDIGGKNYPYMLDESKRWIVTGRYDTRECGGLDGVIKNRNVMKVYLNRLMREVSPDVIVFEAVMYGMTFKFGKECAELCKGNGYEYTGVLLAPDLGMAFSNVYKRNGGKPIDEDRFAEKYYRAVEAAKKLKAAGIRIAVEDTSQYEKDELYKIVEKQL